MEGCTEMSKNADVQWNTSLYSLKCHLYNMKALGMLAFSNCVSFSLNIFGFIQIVFTLSMLVFKVPITLAVDYDTEIDR